MAIDLTNALGAMNEDVQGVLDWCDQLYNKNFASFFGRQRELFSRLESKVRPITDDELEEILTSVPLELFTVSEVLSKLKISQEVIRMKNKQELVEKRKASTATSLTQKNEEAEVTMVENKLIDTVYTAVIERAEKEISFSRELIMGAKKVWDRRRQAEGANPIGNNIAEPAVPAGPKTFYEQMQESKGNKQPVY